MIVRIGLGVKVLSVKVLSVNVLSRRGCARKNCVMQIYPRMRYRMCLATTSLLFPSLSNQPFLGLLSLCYPRKPFHLRVEPSSGMDTSDEHTVQATSIVEDEHPSKHQHLKKRESSNSPVVVYDCDRKTVQVRNKKNVG